MGQNVNYLLGGQNQLLGADPEVYRQQLLQQEQARFNAMPPQQGYAAQLGTLFGRGATNLAAGRGMFEVTNPVLDKLTQIQDIYSTSMRDADPNDPMSFYTSLQKNFADKGLGQQALMAQLEGKKFEETNLKGEKLKTEVFKANPQFLDAQIAKAREAGDDATANRLGEQRGQIQVQIDLDRAKEVAATNLIKAQTAAQIAQATKLKEEIASGKFDWKVISNLAGTPTHMAKINKKTGETTYEAIALPPNAAVPPVDPKTPAGEKPNAATFDRRNAPPEVTPTPVPQPGSTTSPAATKTTSLYDQGTQTYKLSQDPEYLKIVEFARSNQKQLETDPAFQAQIQQAINQLQAKRQSELGNFVKFQ